MSDDLELWSGWVTTLKEYGVNELIAGLINAGKPLSIIVSQLAYIAAPMISDDQRTGGIKTLMDLLEDEDQLTAFTRALQTTGQNT